MSPKGLLSFSLQTLDGYTSPSLNIKAKLDSARKVWYFLIKEQFQIKLVEMNTYMGSL